MTNLKDYQQEFIDAVKTLETRFPYSSAFAQTVERSSVASSTREDKIIFPDPETGYVLTAFTGSYFIEYSSSSLTFENIKQGVETLMSIPFSKSSETFEIDPGEKLTKDFSQPIIKDPSIIDIKDFLQTARNNREEIDSLSRLIQMSMYRIGYEKRDELFINRNKVLFQSLCRFDSMYYMVLSDGKNSSPIFDGFCKIGGFEHSFFDKSRAKVVVEDGIKVLGAPRLKPGVYDCIFSQEMAGMFAHEAFGHGMETDMFLKKRAKGEQYLGKQVASKLVNMWDNPTLGEEDPEACASFFFDNEGKLASTTHIIKDGILISGMTDLYSASKLKIPRTPNGRRESYSHKPYARMTNTYFEKGNTSFEEMLSKVNYGYYVDYATNGMEDPKGWGIQLESLYAAEIKNGRLTGNIFSPVIVTGYVPDLLMSITAVSDQFKISSMGYCGKGHKEWVKVTDGGPHLLLKARLA